MEDDNDKGEEEDCPLPDDLREILWNFHLDLLYDCGVQIDSAEEESDNQQVTNQLIIEPTFETLL